MFTGWGHDPFTSGPICSGTQLARSDPHGPRWLKSAACVADPGEEMAFRQQDPIDETLDTLDQDIKRLRVEYDQYFMGVRKRPPDVLRGRVQKLVTSLSNDPPRNTGQKFRFHQLNSKYQVFRQMWGRTLREIENGTYKAHRFKADLHEKQRLEAAERALDSPPAADTKQKPAPGRAGIDGLYDALMSARERTGAKGAAPDRDRLAAIVKKQTAQIREKHPNARIKFKVAVVGGKATVKATVSRA